jgi:hypothetical protein
MLICGTARICWPTGAGEGGRPGDLQRRNRAQRSGLLGRRSRTVTGGSVDGGAVCPEAACAAASSSTAAKQILPEFVNGGPPIPRSRAEASTPLI